MKAALDELVEKTEGIDNERMLCDVVDFHLPSFGAIAVELSCLPALFGLVKRFNRAAVLTDKVWIQGVSAFEGKLFPRLEIRVFDRDPRDGAGGWLGSGP